MEDSKKYSDADISDRAHIIESTDKVYSIYNDIFGGSDIIPLNQFINKNLEIPQYVETSKFGILFTSKGGSSLIIGVLKEYGLSVNNKEFVFDEKIVSAINYGLHPFNNIKVDESFEEYKKILNGSSKKDLIVVIRNPLSKFLSGMWMDITNEIENSKILKSKYKVNINGGYHFDIPEDSMKDLVYTYLMGYVVDGEKITTNHSALYNETFYNLINNNSIDNRKLKIIDLDDLNSDILKILQSYYPEIKNDISTDSFWTMRGNHKLMLESLFFEIRNNQNWQLVNILSREIHNDFYYYNIIKHKYKDNFV